MEMSRRTQELAFLKRACNFMEFSKRRRKARSRLVDGPQLVGPQLVVRRPCRGAATRLITPRERSRVRVGSEARA